MVPQLIWVQERVVEVITQPDCFIETKMNLFDHCNEHLLVEN
jgi:hypothetical protein